MGEKEIRVGRGDNFYMLVLGKKRGDECWEEHQP
jgi:hypothetical protein